MRRALGLAVEQGLGRAAAILHNNLAVATWHHEGPSAALELCGEGIDFCERRGIAEMALAIAATRLAIAAACGHAERALADVESVAEQPRRQASGHALIDARSVQLALLA